MATNVFPALALGVGEGDKTIMDNPPRNSAKAIITNRNWIAIALYSTVISVSVIAALLFCKQIITTDAQVENNVAFITVAFAQLFHVFNMSSPHSKLLVNEVTNNKFIWVAIFICTALMVLIFVVPTIRVVLGLVILPGKVWLVCIIAAMLPLLLVQLHKIIWDKRAKQTI